MAAPFDADAELDRRRWIAVVSNARSWRPVSNGKPATHPRALAVACWLIWRACRTSRQLGSQTGR